MEIRMASPPESSRARLLRFHRMARSTYSRNDSGRATTGSGGFETAEMAICASRKLKNILQELHAAAQVPLNSNHRALVNFPNTALYSPLNYLPPAIGIDIGRVFSANPLLLFHLPPGSSPYESESNLHHCFNCFVPIRA